MRIIGSYSHTDSCPPNSCTGRMFARISAWETGTGFPVTGPLPEGSHSSGTAYSSRVLPDSSPHGTRSGGRRTVSVGCHDVSSLAGPVYQSSLLTSVIPLHLFSGR